MSENCDACRYFKSYGSVNRAGGACRRYPPMLRPNQSGITSNDADHPRTFAGSWCGEFEASPPLPAPPEARSRTEGTER